MKRTYPQLHLDDRRKIERWQHAGVSVEIIAEKLGPHRRLFSASVAATAAAYRAVSLRTRGKSVPPPRSAAGRARG